MTPKPIRTVSTVIRHTSEPIPGIRVMVLQDEDGWELPPFRPGAHIDIHLEKRLVRTYSLCNAPHENDRYVIAVKREEMGRGGSIFVHDRLAVGQHLQVSLPRGGMEVDPQEMNIFIAGGIGITPFCSVIRDMEYRGLANYRLYWSSNGPACLPEMIQPAVDAGRVDIVNTLTAPIPDISEQLARHENGIRAFCCGPAPMLDAFDKAVSDWPEERFHVERFTPVRIASDPNAKPFTLVLARSGRQQVVEPGDSIVEALIDMDADISFSCEGGICGLCRTRWIEGPPVHNDRILTAEERAQDVMICVAGCKGPRLVIDA
ncbi:PDR/VanB family oxidoreductase [Paracoccus saliphilus]|uniref:Oxidoreductase n=1 Tax=Paracoccus saliphilus TaxID=405559 RepID=A0AA46A4T0_9RHOB|nr:PDR/VanB family oxidoreductase [Paracoccus saliphilus]WCR01457.1 oxidoreductase [Paracoccus saliphilus]SIS69229.1 vanillate O-demethylase ferredoxin subunit [Paracoccus saliphilus]